MEARGYIVTINPRSGCRQIIETWATSAEQAIRQITEYFLCPRSICTVMEIDP